MQIIVIVGKAQIKEIHRHFYFRLQTLYQKIQYLLGQKQRKLTTLEKTIYTMVQKSHSSKRTTKGLRNPLVCTTFNKPFKNLSTTIFKYQNQNFNLQPSQLSLQLKNNNVHSLASKSPSNCVLHSLKKLQDNLPKYKTLEEHLNKKIVIKHLKKWHNKPPPNFTLFTSVHTKLPHNQPSCTCMSSSKKIPLKV